MLLVYLLIIANIFAFILYGVDKSKAKKGERRISEKTLIFFAAIGGAVGAFAGMLAFRHKTRKNKFRFWVPFFLAVQLVLFVFCLYQNYHLTPTYYDVDLNLERELTIVQVSDLHNQVFGINEQMLLGRIEEEKPDMIVVTGDVVDSYHTSFSIALDFMRGAVKIAPVYYVSGNHELRFSQEELNSFFEAMQEMGVIILDDTYIDFGDFILAGVGDASLYGGFAAYEPFAAERNVIMLAHEPQYTEFFKNLRADLVLTGHFHGGQVILPGGRGFVSPEFKFFPEVAYGSHDIDGMTLIISRGLGNSILPVRVNNYPELVVIRVS